MRKITYYVATSIDGFISGPNEDISGFVAKGKGVDQYMSDLQTYDTVIMGRKTYEFGFKYGLKPGQPAYPHMDHFIFSNTLELENPNKKVKICPIDISIVKALKQKEGTDIYLCGGGEFAGWLLDHELIDTVKLKLNPLILGSGVPIFGTSDKQHQLQLQATEKFESGLQIMTFEVDY